VSSQVAADQSLPATKARDDGKTGSLNNMDKHALTHYRMRVMILGGKLKSRFQIKKKKKLN
jgi:hypothetical protein